MAARIEGLDKVVGKLNKLVALAPGSAAEALRETSLEIFEQSVADTPVDTGQLRESATLMWDTGATFTPVDIQKGDRIIGTYAVRGDTGDVIATGSKDGSINVENESSAPDTKSPAVIIEYPMPYSAAQHEHIEYAHPKGGKAKYLEDAVKMKSGDLEQRIKDELGEMVTSL